MARYDAFISYSRDDEKHVKPIRDLISLGRRQVFWDRREIEPGDDWRERIAGAIAESEVVIVLWCCHSARSEWVQREIDMAIAANRRVVPMLLCFLPAPPSLSARQWIDCRHTLRHKCVKHERATEVPHSLGARVAGHPGQMATPPAKGDGQTWLIVAFLTALALFALVVYLLFPSIPLPGPPYLGSLSWNWLFMLVVAAIAVPVVILRAWQGWRSRTERAAAAAALSIEEVIATSRGDASQPR